MYAQCVCGATDYKIILNLTKEGKNYKILICKKCGLSRTWPVPLEGDEDFYQKQDDYLERKASLCLWRSFAKFSLSGLKKYKKSGKLLDIGCNLGVLVKEAQTLGFNAYGIDPCGPAIKEGKNIFNLDEYLMTGNLATLNFSEASFDVVTLIHCLEHISDLNSILEKIYFILKKDGIILVEVPNFDSFWRILLRQRWYSFSLKQHIWQFEKKSLKNILERNNFFVLKINTRHNMYHRLNFSIVGLIKSVVSMLAYIFRKGDDLIIIAKKC
ncbi:MAG: class I SAM-dependent methyltransferase [Patescibacteria group bacterium]|jgi:2-polyprenyl-3-methyl-5-hydroxy-6-metoxy-1,4-benzoquinol methylase